MTTTYPEAEIPPEAEADDVQGLTDPTPETAGNPDPQTGTDTDAAEPATPDADGAPADPVAEAKALLANYEQAQAQACATELEAVLTKYGMRLEVSPAQITLVPADKG